MELGATVPGRGFYLALSQLERVDEVLDAAVAEYATNIRQVASLAGALRAGVPAS